MVYDKPVTLQVQDADTEKWTDYLSLHARVNKASGDQSWNADADQYQARLKFDFRWMKQLEVLAYGVQPYRLIYRGHKFKVTDYDDYMEQHRTVTLVGEQYE